MKNNEQFGTDKNNKLFSHDSIINNNTFIDYINHVLLAGLTPLEFYLESLLHETTHLLGIDGRNALREGIAELKTRELASKYKLNTSGCGYPKEVKIASILQDIFGTEIINKIAFSKNQNEVYNIITSILSINEYNLFINIEDTMNNIFKTYYTKQYSGKNGAINKALEYDKIDYEKVYIIINEYLNINSKKGLNLI